MVEVKEAEGEKGERSTYLLTLYLEAIVQHVRIRDYNT